MKFNNTNQLRKPGDGYFVGTTVLYFIPPTGPGPRKIQVSLEKVENGPGKTPTWLWDGNAVKPTLTPSLDIQDEDGNSRWHGYLQDGIFMSMDDLSVELETKESEMHDADGNVIDNGEDSKMVDVREVFGKTLDECPVMDTLYNTFMDAVGYFSARDQIDYDHGIFTEKMLHVRDAVEKTIKEYGA